MRTAAANAMRVTICTTLATCAAFAVADAQPVISKVFAPASIGPGSVSTAAFTITNGSAAPVTGLGFTDVLPNGITIAGPANASNSCTDAILDAPDGGGTIDFSGGVIGAFTSCTITVDVTGSTPGTHTNPAITLSSSAGSSMSLPVDLVVTATLPGFSKSFAPNSVPLGGRSTLTLTIDNTANASGVDFLDFTDDLPLGMEIADPPNATTDCGTATIPPVLTASSGTGVIVLDANGTGIFPAVAAGATCTVNVDVVTTGAGDLHNISENLQASFVPCGTASATLEVTVTPLGLRKSFADDPAPPGGTVTLDFTIDNFDRDFAATDISFTDDLGATLAGLTFASLLANDCGGSVSGTGTTTLGFSGGTVGPEGSCTISTALSVPAGATPGAFTNTTGAITATVDGLPVVGNTASDDLFVEPVPVLTTEFLDSNTNAPDPVVSAGGDVTIRFTITNTSATSDATDITFRDELTTFLPFPVSVSLPPSPDPPCGGSSSLALVTFPIDRQSLDLTGGTLAAADSCTFDVVLTLPNGLAPGVYVNTTEEITATVDGATRTGAPAGDDLTVIAAPRLTASFTDDPVAPGGTVTLEFTLTQPFESGAGATDIAFTDDLASVLAGMTATLPPNPDPPCGTGSTLSGSAGDTLLTLTGGALAAGESCTFSVTLDVPGGAPSGRFTNTTSGVSATVLGAPAMSPPAEDDLSISGLTFTKEFIDDPVIPGDTTTLHFTIENIHPTDDATITFFTDNLAANLPGLAAVGPPSVDTCGGSLSGTTTLVYVGGNLLSGQQCTIDVTVFVPAAAADGTYANITSSLSATLGGTAVVIDPAIGELTVNSNLLQLTKEFTDDPVSPGGTATLRFTLTNLEADQPASGISFSDDLGAALAGLTISSVPADTCGGSISGTGTTLLTFSGGSLAAGGQCQFDVTLSVPGGAAPSSYTNTTGEVTGTIGGFAVSGNPASDDFVVGSPLQFTKSFDGPTSATGHPVLTFTIANPGSTTESDLRFSDDLDSVLTGLVATNLPISDVCGANSVLSGTSFLTLTGATLPPMGGTCTFDVGLQVPASATPGTFPNTTSALLQNGLPVAEPATADLVVEPPPTFAKVFSPAMISLGLGSTLTFTIDNSTSAVAASGLVFTDNLPPPMVVASPANAGTTCTGGTLTAVAGSNVVSYSNGAVAAGAACTIQVDVAVAAAGIMVNATGALTSSSGNSGTANATLVVSPQPGFSKAFAPDAILTGGVSTLTLTIDNTASTVDATAVDFTDSLPASIVVATPANASTTCTGGTLTAVSGTGSLSYSGGTVAAASSCTVMVDVTGGAAGNHVNLTGDLTSSLGNSGTATDALIVEDVTVSLEKTFLGGPALRGGAVALEFTVTNPSPTFTLTDIAFSDDLDAALSGMAATGLPANDVCGAGSQLSGITVLAFTGGSLAPSASCTFQVGLQIPADASLGLHANTTSPITAQAAGAPVSTTGASDDLEIVFLGFEKSFAGDAGPGATIPLSFTITNPSLSGSAQAIAFTDDLDAVLPGLVAIGLPVSACGGTADAIPDSGTIDFSGGTLAPGASCTFEVTLEVPAEAPLGGYTNTTSIVTADIGGQAVAGDASGVAEDVLMLRSATAIPALYPLGLLFLVSLVALYGVWVLGVKG